MRILPRSAAAVSTIPKRRFHAATLNLVDLVSKSKDLKCDLLSDEGFGLARRNGLLWRQTCYGRVMSLDRQRSIPHSIHNRRFTSGGGSSKPVFTKKCPEDQHQGTHRIVAVSEQDLDDLLTSASIRAREISALAMTNTNRLSAAITPSTLDQLPSSSLISSPPKEPENAVEAADALLTLTSHINFKMALNEKREKQQRLQEAEQSRDATLYLHSAFITVISWLCSVLNSMPSSASNQRDMTTTNFEMRTSEQNFILAKILDLMCRSTDLKLPLHLPLYRQIATLLAKYNTTSDTALLILDLSTQARLALSVRHELPSSNSVLTSQFFSEPLKILAKSNQTRQIIDVIEGMSTLHQLEDIDNLTAYEILMILTQNLDEIRRNIKENPDSGLMENYQVDEADVMQLTIMLETYLSEQMNEEKNEIENVMKRLDLTENELDENGDKSNLGQQIPLEFFDDDDATRSQNENSLFHDKNENNESSIESLELDTKSLDEKIDTIAKGEANEELVEEAKKEADALIKMIQRKSIDKKQNMIQQNPAQSSDDKIKRANASVTARVHVDPVTGNIENVELAYDPKSSLPMKESHGTQSRERERFSEKMHQSMVNDMIYVRNSEAWDLPDIMQQLEKWNNDNDILLTKEYEEALLKDLMSNEEEDDLIGSEHWSDFDFDESDDDDDDDGFSTT